MLAINAGQMDSLQEEVDARFIATEARRLSELAPARARICTESGMAAAVHHGLRIARNAGFRETRQIRICLDLLLPLGTYYDSDPQYQWLLPLLDPGSELPVSERSRLLYWHTSLYLERAHGKDAAHGGAALDALGKLSLASLAAVGASYHEKAPQMLAWLHPMRMSYLSGAGSQALIDSAWRTAPSMGLDGPDGPPLLLCLKSVFGHRVTEDPQHPWVRESLSDSSTTVGTSKVAVLWGKCQSVASALRLDDSRIVT